MKAPFPYPGGKGRAALHIWQALGTDAKRYMEPFCGSMAVLLARPRWPDSCIEIVNDLDGCLVNAWRSIRMAPEAVVSALEDLGGGHEVTLAAISRTLRERREGLTERLRAELGVYDVELAAAWLHGMCASMRLNRPNPTCDIRGDSGYLSHSRRECDLAVKLKQLGQRLRRVKILCGDWARAVSGVTNSAILLDPPYVGISRDDLYSCESAVYVEVLEWATEHGQREDLRIIFCGLVDGFAWPSGWTHIDTGLALKLGASHSSGAAKERQPERLYISPHCHPVDGEQPCVEGEPIRRRQPSIFDLVENAS